jgi:NADPH-dependent 2,4-dienoyl-CoA reductase/sulfur reductase-like enzyme
MEILVKRDQISPMASNTVAPYKTDDWEIAQLQPKNPRTSHSTGWKAECDSLTVTKLLSTGTGLAITPNFPLVRITALLLSLIATCEGPATVPKSTDQTPNSVKHVVIVGVGFAGLNCARKLAANPHVRITLLDKNNYQQFQPLLYQVATAVLGPGNIAFNLRATLRSHPNVDVKMTEVVSIDPNTRTVKTAEGQHYEGDFLVLAAGSQANFFGTPPGSGRAQLSTVLPARR